MRGSARLGEEGFSYMDTILALFIAAVSLTALTMLVLGLFRTPFRLRTAAMEAASTARLDRAIRIAAARVQGPWWTDGPELLLSPHDLTVDWLDGVREKTLHINISTGELSIDLDGELSCFRFPESWTPRFFPPSSGTGIRKSKKGFRLLLDTQGTGAEIYAPFGSGSLAEDSR